MLSSHRTRYIMLDFDGVTHHFFPLPGEDAHNGYFMFLPNIEAVVRQCPYPVKIVITSTWRLNRTMDVLRGHFAPDIAPLVVGGTPKSAMSNKPGGRLGEIKAWIAENDPGAPWVALDDTEELFAAGQEERFTVPLVRCPDEFGATQAQQLREALDDPQAWARQHPVYSY